MDRVCARVSERGRESMLRDRACGEGQDCKVLDAASVRCLVVLVGQDKVRGMELVKMREH